VSAKVVKPKNKPKVVTKNKARGLKVSWKVFLKKNLCDYLNFSIQNSKWN